MDALHDRNKPPCKGCPDRTPGCSDRCQKPEFLAWKQLRQRIRENRSAYSLGDSYTHDAIHRSQRGKR